MCLNSSHWTTRPLKTKTLCWATSVSPEPALSWVCVKTQPPWSLVRGWLFRSHTSSLGGTAGLSPHSLVWPAAALMRRTPATWYSYIPRLWCACSSESCGIQKLIYTSLNPSLLTLQKVEFFSFNMINGFRVPRPLRFISWEGKGG